MNDNLPEIDFKEKKEKKGGALGWLRGKLGMGSRGAVGEAGINPAAMNAGRALNLGGRGALGAGKFGASSGIAGMLAGKAGILATVAMVAVAGGVYLANNAPAPSTSTAAFSSNKNPDNYVPAILRSQAANQGSSLDMFKETNKGAGLGMEAEAKPAAKPEEKPADAAADAQAQDPNAANPDQSNMAQEMMGKLQGGSMGSLTSQLGGGSGKFSNMGGFGNKFGSGATGAKTGFSSGIGAGFSSMPKFDSRKGKMLAMKGSARPVFSGAKAGSKKPIGAGAFGQAKGMRDIQKSFSGTSIDGARSTQDKAWEGSTGEGDASGSGAGLSDGGAGIVTSPSLDNAGSGGGGGGTGDLDNPTIPETPTSMDNTPWAGLANKAMMYILLSAALSAAGGALVKVGQKLMAVNYTATIGMVLWGIGIALCVAALVLGLMALMNGITIMSQHGQAMQGIIYMLGGGVAMAAAVMGMTGASIGPVTPMWMSAIAGIVGLGGSMLGGK